MNLLVLLAALLPWAASPGAALFRIYAAIALLSLEMQVVTLSGFGSLYLLPFVNVPAAVAAALWQRRMPLVQGWIAAWWRVAPWPALVVLAAIVLALNLLRPLEAADPYHLERMAQIQRLGTLEYDPAAIPKVNIVGWLYELVLADLAAVPVIGTMLVRIHGVLNLALYLVALAAVREWLQRERADAAARRSAREPAWPWIALLVVPVVFHLFVLIKNDLFFAIPALAALVWLVARAAGAREGETARVGALTGFVAGAKLTNLPLALLLAGGLCIVRREAPGRALAALAIGGLVGATAGGLFFTSYENARWYGDPLASAPVAEMGNRTAGPGEAAQSVVRFGISLVDLGQVTPRVWPGRGGWGSTFGLPFIWAAIVLAAHLRTERCARWILSIAAAHFLAFAAVFPDADLAQRLVLASGLLVIVGAVDVIERGGRYVRAARLALVPVLILSTMQIARSAMLYFLR